MSTLPANTPTSRTGIFDYNDEVVFMSQDLGERAPGEPQIGSGWYELRVTDPVSPTQEGWIYLVDFADRRPFKRPLIPVAWTSWIVPKCVWIVQFLSCVR